MQCLLSMLYVLLGVATFWPIFCVGKSISQALGGTQIRQARSPHLLYRRMCPSGTSRENCFYSQLSMFMKLHDSLTDPVAMRNIGKRSGRVTSGNGPNYQPVLGSNNLDSVRTKLWETPYNGADSVDESNTPAISYYTDRLNDIQNGLAVNGNGDLSSLPWEQPKRNSYSSASDDNQFLPPPRKRQIICPSGMTRMQCYDNALAFYMRLMRTMGDQ